MTPEQQHSIEKLTQYIKYLEALNLNVTKSWDSEEHAHKTYLKFRAGDFTVPPGLLDANVEEYKALHEALVKFINAQKTKAKQELKNIVENC